MKCFVRSYDPNRYCYWAKFKDGEILISETFDIDKPSRLQLVREINQQTWMIYLLLLAKDRNIVQSREPTE